MPNKKFYQKNKEKVKQQNKEYKEANKEKIKKRWQEYYQNNQEKIIEYNRNRYEKNRSSILAKTKQYRQDNPEKCAQVDYRRKRQPKERFRQGKASARKRQLSWTLTFDEFVILTQQPCYYCNYELGKPVETSAGLDRLNNELGYEPKNVVSCCELCNKLRGEYLTPEQTKVAVNAIIEYDKSHNSPYITDQSITGSPGSNTILATITTSL
jgi:hypothetical protein